MQFAAIEEAINEIQEGRMVIIVDDEDRENEGDLMIAADKVTPEAINFMATYGRGLICLSMTAERLDHLNIPLMVSDHSNTSPRFAFPLKRSGMCPPVSPPSIARRPSSRPSIRRRIRTTSPVQAISFL